MNRRIRWLGGMTVGVGLSLFASTPAFAECDRQPNRWPAFSEVAPSAERIVVGTVIGPSVSHIPGPYYVGLDVRVNQVLRGPATERIAVNALRSGLPLTGPGSCRQNANLYARVGDVIAFAFEGRLPGVDGRVNTAAWIEGRPHALLVPGPQRLTLDEVRYVASLPDTATRPEAASGPRAPDRVGVQILLLVLVAGAAGFIARRLQMLRHPRI